MLRCGLTFIAIVFAASFALALDPALANANENILAGARSIKVQANTQIKNQGEILLGDIAKFEGFTPGEVKRLEKLVLTDAPQVGEARVFSGATLSQTFRSQIKSFEADSSEKITILVPAKVTITKKPFALEQAEIEKQLSARFKENCATCEFDFVQISLPILDSRLDPSSQWSLRVRPEMPRGTFTVPLEITSGSHAHKTYWITGQVEIRKIVAVAKRNISIGEKIDKDDFAFEKKNITYVTDSNPSESELTSAFAARSIQAEQVIGRAALRKESALRYGESVKVVSRSQNWQISIEGVAQQTASLGDVVKVKITHTQKLVSGVLIEKGVVEIR